MKKIILIILGIVALYSCSKEDYQIIDYVAEDYTPNISLSGFVSGDSIYACLSHTQKRQFYASIYEEHDCNPPMTENTCNIDIYEDDVFFCTLTPKQTQKVITGCSEDSLGYGKRYTKYYYTSYQKTKPNSTYSIRLNHPDYGEIQAETIFPDTPKVNIDTSYVLKKITLGSYQNNFSTYDTVLWCVNVKIKIDDDANNKNYYLLDFGNYSDGLFFDIDGSDYYLPISNPLFENDTKPYHLFIQHNIGFPGYLLSDKTFDGSSFGTEFCIPVVDSSFTFSVSALSEEQYQYLLSSYNYMKSEIDPFGKPMSLYSNVNNEIGIFGGYYHKKYVVNLKPISYDD